MDGVPCGHFFHGRSFSPHSIETLRYRRNSLSTIVAATSFILQKLRLPPPLSNSYSQPWPPLLPRPLNRPRPSWCRRAAGCPAWTARHCVRRRKSETYASLLLLPRPPPPPSRALRARRKCEELRGTRSSWSLSNVTSQVHTCWKSETTDRHNFAPLTPTPVTPPSTLHPFPLSQALRSRVITSLVRRPTR